MFWLWLLLHGNADRLEELQELNNQLLEQQHRQRTTPAERAAEAAAERAAAATERDRENKFYAVCGIVLLATLAGIWIFFALIELCSHA